MKLPELMDLLAFNQIRGITFYKDSSFAALIRNIRLRKAEGSYNYLFINSFLIELIPISSLRSSIEEFMRKKDEFLKNLKDSSILMIC